MAMQIIDQIANEFECDATKMQLTTLEKIDESSSLFTTSKELAEVALPLAENQYRQKEYETANEFVDIACKAALKAREPDLITQTKKLREEIKLIVIELQKIKPFIEKLDGTPDDPESNLRVGLYEAFTTGRIRTGFEKLAKGSDERLRDLAQMELGEPTHSKELLVLADGWWDYAESNEEYGDKCKVFAMAWYEKALPGLSGLERTRVERRLGRKSESTFASNTVNEAKPVVDENSTQLESVILVGKWRWIDASNIMSFEGRESHGDFRLYKGRKTHYKGRWYRKSDRVTLGWETGQGKKKRVQSFTFAMLEASGKELKIRLDGKVFTIERID